jgi:TRAP-type C4-dicarboxylate transport system permease small subunit
MATQEPLRSPAPPEELVYADEVGRRKIAEQWARLPAAWRRLDAALLMGTQYLLCVMGILFAAMITLEVLSRYVFDFSMYFVNAAARLLLVWFFMVGAGIALRHGAHVGFELLLSRLSHKARRVVMMIGFACAAAFSAEMLFAGIASLGPAWRQSEPGLDIPLAWPILAIPVGFGLLLYHIAVLVWIETRSRSGGRA